MNLADITLVESILERTMTSGWGYALGWALLQFIWQATVFALSFALLRRAIPQVRVRERYQLGVLTLLMMVFVFVVTAADAAWRTSRGEAPWSTLLAFWSVANESPHWLRQQWLQQSWTAALPWLSLGWMAGLAFFTLRSALQLNQVRRLTTTYASPIPDAILQRVHQLRLRMGVSNRLRLVMTSKLVAPGVTGFFRPVLLLPVRVVEILTPVQLEAVIAHELAHLRRHDHWLNGVQCCLETLFFFHPAVWWVSARVREDREYCCDDVAVDVCGDAVAYARSLSLLEEVRAGDFDWALASTGGNLMLRIKRLFTRNYAGTSRVNVLAAATLLTLMTAAMLTVSCNSDPVETEAISQDTQTDTAKTVPDLIRIHDSMLEIEKLVGEMTPADEKVMLHLHDEFAKGVGELSEAERKELHQQIRNKMSPEQLERLRQHHRKLRDENTQEQGEVDKETLHLHKHQKEAGQLRSEAALAQPMKFATFFTEDGEAQVFEADKLEVGLDRVRIIDGDKVSYFTKEQLHRMHQAKGQPIQLEGESQLTWTEKEDDNR